MIDHVNMAASPAKCHTANKTENATMREVISMRALNHKTLSGA